jgi:deoxycytidylate deaminase
MPLHFSSGDFESLKEKLQSVINTSLWEEININTYRAKLGDGAVINYFVTTGRIMFQGKPKAQKELQEKVSEILQLKNKEAEDSHIDKDILVDNEHDTAGLVESSLVDKTHQDVVDIDQKLEELQKESSRFLSDDFPDSEIVIALVGAIGVEYKHVVDIIQDRLRVQFKYISEEIRVSKQVIREMPDFDKDKDISGKYDHISYYMEQGNMTRKKHGNNAILAMGASKVIKEKRSGGERRAYIINSLKHPDEIKYLREVYGHGFYLIGVFSDLNKRSSFLTEELKLSDQQAEDLMKKDKDSEFGHGLHTSDAFHLSDYFVYIEEDRGRLKNGIYRFLDIIFGSPTVTPTFDEYSMFMAFTAALRSADLSRQVGAVITKDEEILSTGANDTPKAGGGLYWPSFDNDEKHSKIADFKDGRDYTRGYDSNVIEKKAIIDGVLAKLPIGIDKDVVRVALEKSQIKDLTEYGRVVHAEMEALMVCARTSLSAKGSTLYCTTFPCHNCAKHIVDAGVARVVYVEPYAKSKALEFHSEAVKTGFKPEAEDGFVYFEPFVGLGPRKFFDMFSMSLGSGRSIIRKTKDGKLVEWDPSSASLKTPLSTLSYKEREERAVKKFTELISKENGQTTTPPASPESPGPPRQ